jgi:electron transfer flavoprotein alpha/beta subunit
LLGVSSELNQPRYPAMKGVLIAKRASIPTWRPSDIGLTDLDRRVEVRRLYVETRETRTEHVTGDSPAAIGIRLAERLHEEGLI